MGFLVALLDLDRKELITAAFAVLMVAAAIVSLGAWALLRREDRGEAAADAQSKRTSRPS